MISDEDAEKFGEIDLSRIATGHARGGKTEAMRRMMEDVFTSCGVVCDLSIHPVIGAGSVPVSSSAPETPVATPCNPVTHSKWVTGRT